MNHENIDNKNINSTNPNDELNIFLDKMELRVVNKDNNFLEIDILNVPVPIVNTLRRILINEIPIIAIDKVTIFNNTGIMSDENLCHRIGLIPLLINDHRDTKYILNVKNEGKSPIEIFSNDFQIHCNYEIVGNGMVPDIYLTKLAPKQEIYLECIPNIGTGKMHAKWSPVCPATYRFLPYIGDKIFRNLKVSNFEGKEVMRNENHIIFTINTHVIDPFDLLERSFDVLNEKCDNLKKNILEIMENL